MVGCVFFYAGLWQGLARAALVVEDDAVDGWVEVGCVGRGGVSSRAAVEEYHFFFELVRVFSFLDQEGGVDVPGFPLGLPYCSKCNLWIEPTDRKPLSKGGSCVYPSTAIFRYGVSSV